MAERSDTLLRFAAKLPAWILVALIRTYQRVVSPALRAMSGPGCGCRFAPSCSHYAVDAVKAHGALRGSWLAIRRLAKCTPLHAGGFDPVPPTTPRIPRCERGGPRTLASSH